MSRLKLVLPRLASCASASDAVSILLISAGRRACLRAMLQKNNTTLELSQESTHVGQTDNCLANEGMQSSIFCSGM